MEYVAYQEWIKMGCHKNWSYKKGQWHKIFSLCFFAWIDLILTPELFPKFFLDSVSLRKCSEKSKNQQCTRLCWYVPSDGGDSTDLASAMSHTLVM